MNEHEKHAEFLVQNHRKRKESEKRTEYAEIAMIELAKQNWAQRHWIWWTIISILSGGIMAYMLELLKIRHWLGL